jgi:hypothetical protein
MKALLATTCAVACLTGVAFAQTQDGKQPANQPAQNQQTQQQTRQAPAGKADTSQANQANKPNTKQQGAATQQGGIQSVAPVGTVRLTFYEVQPADIRASKLMDANVVNLNNENIGEIEDVVVDNGKTIKALIVSVGGFLGIGDHNVAIDPKSVTVTEQENGGVKIVVNTNKDELKNAPKVTMDDLNKTGTSTSTTGSGQSSSTSTGAQDKAKDNKSR